ncbi:hypothetical protein COLO4_27705 [Corchorus olitorius]|uniref:Uncharacterized protein n=1 Tax=Corchorus olitorius TaxID=93759 RepID=A0A1R3HPU7_9ROSI|nr:hypothetical protein COLO4_27705 [Corchorus olitorius]
MSDSDCEIRYVGFYRKKAPRELGNLWVLKARKKKPGRHRKKWKVLKEEDVPKVLRKDRTRVHGSFVYEDGKQFILLVLDGWVQFLCTYNAESNSWGEKKVDHYHPTDDFPAKDFDLFLGKSFAININSVDFAIQSALGFHLEGVESMLKPSEVQVEEYLDSRDKHDLPTSEGEPYPGSWHILPLRGKNFIKGKNKKLCLLAFYEDTWVPTCYVRFATFDFVDHAKPPERKRRRHRVASEPTKAYKIENCVVESIPIAEEHKNNLLPYTMVCSQVVSSIHN